MLIEVLISLIIGLVILVLLLSVAAVGLVIGQLIWSMVCVHIIRWTRPEGKRAKWLACSIPTFIPIYIAALALTVWSVWPDKHDAYETAFGTQPSPTVTIHQGDVSGFADSVTIELHFSATPTDIQRITANGYQLKAQPLTSLPAHYPAIPSTITRSTLHIYTGPAPFPEFTHDEAVLIFDPATQQAWYIFDGVH